MPTYDHQCQDPKCAYIWEDQYSIKVDPPKQCPKCLKNTAKRIISLPAKGVVELSGDDLVAKIKRDAKQIQIDASRNEKLYSNLLGENRYQNIQQSIDKNKRR